MLPAHPLALTARRRLDERRQRALTRYYLEAGAGGIAVGVHTTQFAIHAPTCGLLAPVLQLAAETSRAVPATVLIAGVIGGTRQAVREAALARDLGYHAVLLAPGGPASSSDAAQLERARAVAAVMPVIGFYLQPAVGGRVLGYRFWRSFAEIENVAAIKLAPFDRYATGEVIRAVADAGRARDIALYTGNDDHILLDLLTRWSVTDGAPVRMVGGLLGQWACWTRQAVADHRRCTALARSVAKVPAGLLTLATQLTDANGAIFDAANGFRGCIAGIHEILRRQGLLAGRWCLDPAEDVSPGQLREIDRVCRAYPALADDAFVREGIERWMR